MKHIVAASFGVALAFSAACKSTNDQSALRENGPTPEGGFNQQPPQQQTEAGVAVLTLSGAAAQEVYTKASWQTDASGAKVGTGNMDVVCTMQGALPPGAQGFPGQITYQCSASSHWPEGAQGFPGPAFFIVEGQAAMQFWSAFQVQQKYDNQAGWYIKKHVSQNGTFRCTKAGGYQCVYGEGNVGGGNGGGNPGNGGGAGQFLSLSGAAATAVYNAASMPADGAGTKATQGLTDVVCTMQGALPPGAQGFPGQITYQCSASSHWPEGAQGFPGPAYFIVEGQTAMQFWQAFQVEAKYDGQAGWYIKKKVTSQQGTFKCTTAGGGHKCIAN